jgi:hypothetical protein
VESIRTNMPKARCKPIQEIDFVNSDNAGDLVLQRSRTGILYYLNRSPIVWFTKKQNFVETSTFGSEFMALKTAVEMKK